MYLCKYDFIDLQDEEYKYKAGDTYPREGYTPSEDRINELVTASNRQGRELIMEIKTKENGKDPEKGSEPVKKEEVKDTPIKEVVPESVAKHPSK